MTPNNTDNAKETLDYSTARDVHEMRRIIPLEWYWRIAAGLLSLVTATGLFWLSHTYVSKEDYTADLKLTATAADHTSTAVALRMSQLSQDNEHGRTEITKELTGRMSEMQDVLLKMKESLIRMEEKARVDEQQNQRLAEVERRITENREMLIRGQGVNVPRR